MTTPEITQIGMSLEQFLEDYNEQPFELIGGEKVFLMPGVAGHGHAIENTFLLFWSFLQTHPLGKILREDIFILPENQGSSFWVKDSRVPDLMYYERSRFEAYIHANPDWKKQPYAIVPDFVIEVISPNDKHIDIQAKVQQYLEDGVRLIWLLDFINLLVTVHRLSVDSPVIYRMGQVIDANDIVEGLTLTVDELFA